MKRDRRTLTIGKHEIVAQGPFAGRYATIPRHGLVPGFAFRLSERNFVEMSSHAAGGGQREALSTD